MYYRIFQTVDPDDGITNITFKVFDRRNAAKSMLFYCGECGEVYAKVRSFIERRQQPFQAYDGVCYRCPGNRFSIPGNLDALLRQEEIPASILRYCLLRELDFYLKERI